MKHLYLLIVDHCKEIFSGLKGPNSFVRNVAYNLSGNTVVLGIGFLLTPIVARIYGPAAYGQFAVFTAIASLIQPISTFQLPAGYVSAKSNEQFSALVKISFATLFFVTLIVFLGAILHIKFGSVSQFPKKLALFLPLYIFFSGIFSISRGWNIKLEEFSRSALSKVIASITGKLTTLGYGWFIGQSAIGMITGNIIIYIIESVGYASNKMWRDIKLVFHTQISFKSIRRTFHDFIEYPKYVTTNALINNFSTQIPIYFIAAWYSTEKVGLFSLSLSLIIIPINLFGNSIGAVFLPKISSIIEDENLRNKAIFSLYKKLFYPGVIGLVLFAIILRIILPLLLGDSWEGIGHLSAVVAVSFAFSVVALPLSNTYRLIKYENINLIITILFLFFKISGMLIVSYIGDFRLTIFIYLLINLIHHGVKIIVLFKKLKITFNYVIRDLLIIVIFYITIYIIL